MFESTSESFKRYIKTASKYISKDHLTNFLSAGVALNERQLEFCGQARKADFEEGPFHIGYGGARGGGKSFGALAQLLVDDCQRSTIKGLYLRKSGVAAREQFDKLRRPLLANIDHKYSEFYGRIKFPNGSVVIIGYYQRESDIDRYLGLEYDIILIEEATQLSYDKVNDVTSCARTSKRIGELGYIM